VKALHQQLKDENKRNLIISLISKRKGYAQQIQQMTSRWNSFKTNSTEKRLRTKVSPGQRFARIKAIIEEEAFHSVLPCNARCKSADCTAEMVQ